MRLVRNENVIMRTIHGSIFLIDITDNYSGDNCSLYEINETGRFLWNSINGNVTMDDLVTSLQGVITDEVPYEIIYEDVSEFINSLEGKGFIIEEELNG